MSQRKRLKKAAIQEESDGEGSEGVDNVEEPAEISSDFDEDDAQHPSGNNELEGSGTIERITLQNFMCHRNLDIRFGPQINFVVGVNGSGKSAILVAITICLGAKAGFSNRGSKLTDLIRTGCNQATVTIQLKNQGSEAYKPDLYGPSIVVKRILKKAGSSSYTIYDHTAKKAISKTHNEISMILEQFNIQIDNPCAILMQDTSRQFLNSSSPKNKYKFFLMATQLEQMQQDFEYIKDQLEQMESIIGKKRRVLPDMETKVRELESEYQSITQIKTLQDKLTALRNKMAWAIVNSLEQQSKKNGI